jgi:hypothetical protein
VAPVKRELSGSLVCKNVEFLQAFFDHDIPYLAVSPFGQTLKRSADRTVLCNAVCAYLIDNKVHHAHIQSENRHRSIILGANTTGRLNHCCVLVEKFLAVPVLGRYLDLQANGGPRANLQYILEMATADDGRPCWTYASRPELIRILSFLGIYMGKTVVQPAANGVKANAATDGIKAKNDVEAKDEEDEEPDDDIGNMVLKESEDETPDDIGNKVADDKSASSAGPTQPSAKEAKKTFGSLQQYADHASKQPGASPPS